MRAVVATLARLRAARGSALFVPALRPLYDYAWFVGFGVAGGAYLGLATLTRDDR